VQPTATAPHLDSTLNGVCCETAKRPELGAKRTSLGHRECAALGRDPPAWIGIIAQNTGHDYARLASFFKFERDSPSRRSGHFP
jgi:hypothetical protein